MAERRQGDEGVKSDETPTGSPGQARRFRRPFYQQRWWPGTGRLFLVVFLSFWAPLGLSNLTKGATQDVMQGVFGPWYPTDIADPPALHRKSADAPGPADLSGAKTAVLLVRESKLDRKRWPLHLGEHRQVLEALISYGVRAIMVDLVLLDRLHGEADWAEFCGFLREHDAQTKTATLNVPLIVFADNMHRSANDAGLVSECLETVARPERARHQEGWVATAYAPKTWDPIQGVVRRYPARDAVSAAAGDGWCATASFLIYQWLIGGERPLHAKGPTAYQSRCANMPVPKNGDFSQDMVVMWNTRFNEINFKWMKCNDDPVFGDGPVAGRIIDWMGGVFESLLRFNFFDTSTAYSDGTTANGPFQQICPPVPVVPLEEFLPEIVDPTDRAPRIDQDIQYILEGATVFYGVGLDVGADVIYTPTHGALPGVFFHAMAFDNLLRYGNYYYRIRPTLSTLMELSIGLSFLFCFHSISTYIAPRWRRRECALGHFRGYDIYLRHHFLLGIIVTFIAISISIALISAAHFSMHMAPMDWIFLLGIGGLGISEIFSGRPLWRLERKSESCIV